MNNKNNVSSTMKKYQFFEVCQEGKTEDIKNTNKSNTISTLLIKDISPSGINQMQSIEDIIFICGKAIHKVKSKMIRESLIVKIINNKIIDEYRIFNGLYYDFKLKFFKNKPTFVVLGGELIKYMKNNKEEMLMVTTIKIYNASFFIEPKYERYISDNINGESYPKALMKKIQILKKTDGNEFLTEIKPDMNIYDGYESFQNVIAFSINSDFSHIAISSDKGDIILMSGYPNIIDCGENEIRMRFLPKIIPKDREIYITNLELTELINKKENKKRILYASTANSIYYYEWKYDTEYKSSSDTHIRLKTLIEGGKGAYNSCLNSKNNYLLIASSNDNYILEFKNLALENSWYFEGNKIFAKYFKDYILFIIYDYKCSIIQIYDKANNFLLFNYNTKNKIISVCCNSNYIYIFFEENQNLKYIIKLKEKENKKKFEIFYSKNQYDIAREYAERINSGPSKIAEISRRYAEYEYSKGEYEQSIKQYIKTINYLEPNCVIQKFLEKAKLDYLIKYLEALVENEAFQKKGYKNINDFSHLLFNCYIMQDKISKLRDFIKNKNKNTSYNIIKTAIEVCIETENINVALLIAKQKQMDEEIMELLILKLNKIKEALDYLLPPNNNNNNNNSKDNKINNFMNEEKNVNEKIKLILKYGEYFLKEKNGEISDNFFNRVSAFIENKKSYLDNNDIINLIQTFIISDKYFKSLFDKIDVYGIEYNSKVIHRRIELYLDEKDKEKDFKQKIIKMLKDKKYINIYDKNYLLLLFKYQNFNEGKEILTEIIKNKQDLIQLYMSKNNYDKLIEMIDEIISNKEQNKDKNKDNSDVDLSFISIILKYFFDEKKKNKNKNNIYDKYIQKIINKISNSNNNIFTSVDFLSILYELNEELTINDINNYMNSTMSKELVSTSTYLYNINEINKQLNETEKEIKEINTKATCYHLNKCDECNMSINFPCICFLCGHCFHQLCVNTMIYEKKENNKSIQNILKCPKCKKN